MKLPYWLIKSLPMWSYICPKCRREVRRNSHKCPHCGERYLTPIRVPPIILKDRKLLEDYVHQNIFPKISKLQRIYLAQYFTELFSDAFQSGDFIKWNDYSTGSDFCEVVNTDPYLGTYHARSYTNGGGGVETARFRKDLASGESELYTRQYVKVVTSGIADDGDSFLVIQFHNSAGEKVAYCGWSKHEGSLRWTVGCRNGTGYANNHSSETPVIDNYYCVELHWVKHATAGLVELYVDGLKVAEVTGQDTDDYGDAQKIAMGLMTVTNCGVCEVYSDCCIIADTYIGTEGEGSTSKVWSLVQIFTKLNLLP